jgi:hypothetical protein
VELWSASSKHSLAQAEVHSRVKESSINGVRSTSEIGFEIEKIKKKTKTKT